MKLYIQTDIEGVAGFCYRENRVSRDYEVIRHRYRMYKLLTAEVNAAVRASFDSGADEVIVNDNHGSGYNILFEELDPRCRIIHGRNCSGPHWLPKLDSTFDGIVLIGMHAMGGTPGAIIPHSKWEMIALGVAPIACIPIRSMASKLESSSGIQWGPLQLRP